MPEIPANSLFGYIGTVFFLLGVFLILSGLGIVKIQQITVNKGAGTLVTGVIIAIIGGILISSEIKTKGNDANILPAFTPTVVSALRETQTFITPTVIPAYIAVTNEEVANIRWRDEIPVFNGAITISLDRTYGENNIEISVRSPGYPRETYTSLSISDKVVFHGDSDFEILITDYKAIGGFVPDYEIQVVVKKMPKSEYTATPEYMLQEIVLVKLGEEVSVFDGEIFVEYIKNGLLGKEIKIRSSGYVSEDFVVGVGSKIKYEGKHSYAIVITNYSNIGLELTVYK